MEEIERHVSQILLSFFEREHKAITSNEFYRSFNEFYIGSENLVSRSLKVIVNITITII